MENNNLAKTRETAYQCFLPLRHLHQRVCKCFLRLPPKRLGRWRALPSRWCSCSTWNKVSACDSMTLSKLHRVVMSVNWLTLILAADELVGEREAERWMKGCKLEWMRGGGDQRMCSCMYNWGHYRKLQEIQAELDCSWMAAGFAGSFRANRSGREVEPNQNLTQSKGGLSCFSNQAKLMASVFASPMALLMERIIDNMPLVSGCRGWINPCLISSLTELEGEKLARLKWRVPCRQLPFFSKIYFSLFKSFYLTTPQWQTNTCIDSFLQPWKLSWRGITVLLIMCLGNEIFLSAVFLGLIAYKTADPFRLFTVNMTISVGRKLSSYSRMRFLWCSSVCVAPVPDRCSN